MAPKVPPRFEPLPVRLPAAPLPVLPVGPSPAGTGALATAILNVLTQLSLAFFAKPEFCLLTAKAPVDDPHAMRSEFAPKPSQDASAAAVVAPSSAPDLMPYFLDVRASAGGEDVPETEACRQVRSLLWYYIVAALALQPSLLNGIAIGDIAAVIARLAAVDATNPVTELAQAGLAVFTLAALPSKKVLFSTVSNAFTLLDHILSRDRKTGMAVGPLVLPALLMESISNDTRYSVEHSLMLKEPLQELPTMIKRLVNVVRVPVRQELLGFMADGSGQGTGSQHGRGQGAGAQQHGSGRSYGAQQGRDLRPCYLKKNTGDCNRDGCKFAHDQASMDACILPRPPNRTQSDSPKPPCPVCGEKGHAVNDCPIVKRGRSSQANPSQPTGYAAVLAPAGQPAPGQGTTSHVIPSSLPNAPSTFTADQVSFLLQRLQRDQPHGQSRVSPAGNMAAPIFADVDAERPLADEELRAMLNGGDR
jgi:hypothetical protein